MESKLGAIFESDEDAILSQWRQEQETVIRPDFLRSAEFLEQSATLARQLARTLRSSPEADTTTPEWEAVRNTLSSMSRSWALQGFTPSETATFILSLKRPLFSRVRAFYGDDAASALEETWRTEEVIDQLALLTMQTYQQTREEVIRRQQRELLELSTPVVQLWEGVLVLPLIGTLDSARTQMVMESLLQRIVDTGSHMAIIDITGVAAVDTLVAQHLLKTVAAARLMGADCIISGISPQIAQTIVHLGVDLTGVITKATLASAFALALEGSGYGIVAPQPDRG